MNYRIRRTAPLVLSFTAWISACSGEGTEMAGASGETASPQGTVRTYAGSPYLEGIRNTVLYGDVWERPQLSKRDRSLITIAALQALYRDQVRGHIARGLDNGLTQEEISEIILHVAFYAGWPTAVNASRAAGEVFRERGLPDMPVVETWEPPPVEPRVYTSGGYAAVPRLGELRDLLVYGDVWERPQLSKRDRSLLTIAVNGAIYATNQFRGHLGRGLDEFGVTPVEAEEVILQVAFYAGWPAAVNAAGAAAEVFGQRGLMPESRE
ncbi:MAG: carboxymuconolactone decarboxylase family protein [Gammaproteobacteria bacterium]|nr:carboxymuconolactone decarboxylase family protein [Gammaproteobacteria bacterium]